MRESYYYDSLGTITFAFFAGLAANFFPVVVRNTGIQQEKKITKNGRRLPMT